MEIWKISRGRPRSLHEAELGHFAEVGKEMYKGL